jgi:hypothetical protein
MLLAKNAGGSLVLSDSTFNGNSAEHPGGPPSFSGGAGMYWNGPGAYVQNDEQSLDYDDAALMAAQPLEAI